MSSEIWLNGSYVPYEEATIPIDDRGFQFSESIYEVIHIYSGRPFEMERHMRRLKTGIDALTVDLGMSMDELAEKCMDVVHRNNLEDAMVYIQITTGAAPRIHLRPKGVRPTLIIIANPIAAVTDDWPETSISCMTVPDDRWASCYIKSTMLWPNTVAKGRAVAAGYADAIFVRDGYAIESTSSNLFAVFDGVVWTPPASNYILRGVTREVVLDVAKQEGLPVYEGPIPLDKLYRAAELFITGSGVELLPITSVDGKKIGSGDPGAATRQLQRAFRRRTRGQ